jgi:hypothetical protein
MDKFSQLYMVRGDDRIAFIEGADSGFLTQDQYEVEKLRLEQLIPFKVFAIFPVANGTIVETKSGKDNEWCLVY